MATVICALAVVARPKASGLAAFFYAGARSFLVSHWPVDSAATVKFTTSAFRALKTDQKESDQKIGRAEALRRAMLAMIDNAGRHPAVRPTRPILSIGRPSSSSVKAEPVDEQGENKARIDLE